MIKIVYEEQNLRTAAYDGDKLAGQCTYVVRDGFWDLEHKARERGAKIIPTCSYALKAFEKKAEYADVWSK